MSVLKKSVRMLSVLPVLFLAGCGDGWVMQPYTKTPYGGERTAGSGVEYVLAKMAPKKAAILEPETVKAEPPPAGKMETDQPPESAPVVAPEPAPEHVINDADKLFDDRMRK